MKSSHDHVATAEFKFADDGETPNHRSFPLLVHKAAVAADADESAARIEAMFAANGWGGFWRDGVYPYHHYHTTCHEVLGVATGWADVRFGGEGGETVRLEAGDVAVLPAGTGHKREAASADFLVVGAYPANQPYDMNRSDETDAAGHAEAVRRIAETSIPATDPVFGQDGGLRKAWKAKSEACRSPGSPPTPRLSRRPAGRRRRPRAGAASAPNPPSGRT